MGNEMSMSPIQNPDLYESINRWSDVKLQEKELNKDNSILKYLMGWFEKQ